MEYIIFLVVLSFVWACIRIISSGSSRHRKIAAVRLPPGPYPFPIIGNIFQLGNKPHQSLANLSKSYGPLMSLKLGTMTTIVISSPKIAKEVLQKHDHALSSRKVPNATHVLDHHKVSMVWLPAESKWRNLRKICKEHLFSLPRLDANQVLRRKKVQELLNYVHDCCINGEAVDIGRVAFTTSLNLLTNTFFSVDLAHNHSDSSQEFKDTVWKVMEIVGKPNFADYFPVLKFVDPKGIRRRTKFYIGKVFELFDRIMNQRLESRASSLGSGMSDDVLEALLNLSENNDTKLSRKDIMHLFLDLFAAGTDTSTSTLEWAMAELLHNPEKLAKARTELKEAIGIGEDGVLVQESDISKLPYLQAVVKETLRLHPPAPFLLPHKADADVEIDGFVVPKNAQILVNVWAIGRDSSVWSNPTSFVPERFFDCGIDYKGQDFELIPFGAGRRICPGLPLAYRMVHIVLASLLHSFNWKLEEGMKPEDMDMDEKFGLTLQKVVPLKAIPIKM